MLTSESSLFKKFLVHVLYWEGDRSADPEDTAASCAPYPGAVHTVKGVTYCTFNSYASEIGISPVTYDRFLQLTDRDAAKFLYLFYESVEGENFPDYLALAMTEAAWMSGPGTAAKHLQAALNYLGANLVVDGIIGPKTLAATVQADQDELYQEYWNERIDYINYLITFPKYAKYADGWYDRIKSFLSKFPIGEASTAGAIGFGLSVALLGLAVYLAATMPKAHRAT